MRNIATLGRLACTGLMLAPAIPPARAQTIGFDPPAQVIKIPSSTVPPSGDAVSCYFYSDVMIRVSGTDTPAPDDALILSRSKTGAPQKCDRQKPRGMELKSGGSGFSGRSGNFLVFEWANPTGAGNFTIFDVRDGRKLFADGEIRIRVVTLRRGILHLRYVRGLNASCSLLSDRDGCWSQLLANGQIPPDTFPGPPSIEVCKQGYQIVQPSPHPPFPDDDPSVISYEAMLTLDSNGHSIVQALGALQCNPMP